MVYELNKNIQNVNVYVGDDGKLHFVDSAGADSALPFNNGAFQNVGSVGLSISGDSSYVNCGIDPAKISECKYVKYQTSGGELERYLYVNVNGSTSVTAVTPTALGDNTYEYTCTANQTFANFAGHSNATVMLRATNTAVRFISCKFMASKPT